MFLMSRRCAAYQAACGVARLTLQERVALGIAALGARFGDSLQFAELLPGEASYTSFFENQPLCTCGVYVYCVYVYCVVCVR